MHLKEGLAWLEMRISEAEIVVGVADPAVSGENSYIKNEMCRKFSKSLLENVESLNELITAMEVRKG